MPRAAGCALSLDRSPGVTIRRLRQTHGAALEALKKAAHSLFVPELGGSYQVWKQRPLPTSLVEYAAADVAHLHAMREAWAHLVSSEEMHEITTRRIEKAIASEALPKGPHMADRDF